MPDVQRCRAGGACCYCRVYKCCDDFYCDNNKRVCCKCGDMIPAHQQAGRRVADALLYPQPSND